jgi:hypothetical protein
MRPRSWALLTVVLGLALIVLAVQVSHWRAADAATSGPSSTDPGRSRALAVDWTSANKQARVPVNERGARVNLKFIAANRAMIDQLAIPMLLPSEPDLAAGLRLFPNGAFYSLSSSANGMSFMMTGAGRAFPLSPGAAKGLPQGQLSSRVPADGIVIEQTEAGIDASFTRFGVAYSIALECAQNHNDTRCKDDTYVRGVIGRLMVVTPGAGGGT